MQSSTNCSTFKKKILNAYSLGKNTRQGRFPTISRCPREAFTSPSLAPGQILRADKCPLTLHITLIYCSFTSSPHHPHPNISHHHRFSEALPVQETLLHIQPHRKHDRLPAFPSQFTSITSSCTFSSTIKNTPSDHRLGSNLYRVI